MAVYRASFILVFALMLALTASIILSHSTALFLLMFFISCLGVVIDLGASYMHCVSAHPKEGEGTTDCRWRREPSRSVSGIAAVLQPLVADVAGKQNWESTLFARYVGSRPCREFPLLTGHFGWSSYFHTAQPKKSTPRASLSAVRGHVKGTYASQTSAHDLISLSKTTMTLSDMQCVVAFPSSIAMCGSISLPQCFPLWALLQLE